MMKFEYQVKLFSAGQPPDQIENVLNQSGESGWEVAATFVKQDSTLCFVLKKTTGLKLAAEQLPQLAVQEGMVSPDKKLSLLIAGRPSAFCNSRASGLLS
jgi:signal transduction protein with GAF and PtsI domain